MNRINLPNWHKKDHLNKLYLNITLIFISIILTIIFIDFILHFTTLKDLITIQQKYYTYPKFYYQNDPAIGFDIVDGFSPKIHDFLEYRYKVWSNELGCFDLPYHQEKNIILLVGDSFTWGYADFEKKWGTLVEKDIGIRILKCGVSGFGSKQEGIKIKKVLNRIKIVPKLIIVGYCLGNDMEDDYLFPRYSIINGCRVTKVKLGDLTTGRKIVYTESQLQERFENFLLYGNPEPMNRIKDWLYNHSIGYNLLRNIEILRTIGVKLGVARAKLPDIPLYILPTQRYPWLQAAWKDHLQNLREIKKTADSTGSNLLIILIPKKEQIYEYLRPPYRDVDWDQANKRLKDFFEKENINFLDLTPAFREYADHRPRNHLDPQNDLYFDEDGHFTLKGNKLAGLLVVDYLLKNDPALVTGARNLQVQVAEELQGLAPNTNGNPGLH